MWLSWWQGAWEYDDGTVVIQFFLMKGLKSMGECRLSYNGHTMVIQWSYGGHTRVNQGNLFACVRSAKALRTRSRNEQPAAAK